MVTPFNQVKSSNYPLVHNTFIAKGLNSDEPVEYYINVLTEDRYDEGIKLLFKFHTPEETFLKSVKAHEKDYIFVQLRGIFKNVFDEKVTLACYVSGSHEMVGINALKIASKASDEKEMKKNFLGDHPDPKEMAVMNSVEFVNSHFDVFSYYGVDQYLDGVALCVNTDYRGRGISTELLKAREPLMKILNLTVTATNFSTIGSQKAAEKAGYTEKMAVSYEEIMSKFPILDFSHANTTHCKKYAFQIA